MSGTVFESSILRIFAHFKKHGFLGFLKLCINQEYVFNVFFQNPKNVTFYVFELLHTVFSSTVLEVERENYCNCIVCKSRAQ